MPDLFERATALIGKEQSLLERRYGPLAPEATPEATPEAGLGELPEADLVAANQLFDATVLPPGTRVRLLKGLVLRVLEVFTTGQVIWNAAVVRVLNALERRSRELADASRRQSLALAERLMQVEERRELWETRLLERVEAAARRLSELEVASAVTASREGVQSLEMSALDERVSSLEAEVAGWRARKAEHEELRAAVDRLQAVVAGIRAGAQRRSDRAVRPSGPRERFLAAGLSLPPAAESVARCRPFVRPLQQAAERLGSEPALLDLECGRGDLLAAAREAGLPLAGWDANPVAVFHCRTLGFDVREGGPLSVLGDVADGSLAGVSALHLLESLPLEEAGALLELVHRKLRRGGVVVLSAFDPGTISGLLALHAGLGTRTPVAQPLAAHLLNEAGFFEIAPVPGETGQPAPGAWDAITGRLEYGLVGTKS